jgi:riboflavin kinase / FMN adenylyltransferase
MKVFKHFPRFGDIPNAILTQGTFDGVHNGHQHIIRQMSDIAHQVGGESVLITFDPHPRHVLHTHPKELKILSCPDEKQELLSQAGLDNLVMVPFDENFASTPPDVFVSNILCHSFQLHTLVVGYDHRFGKDRKGDIALLQKMSTEHHFQVVQINEQQTEAITISSSKIRNALSTGDLMLANKLLGKPYTMKARVVKGQQLGRSIGFPTANLEPLCTEKLIPSEGTYAILVHFSDQIFGGMLNIGHNPTIMHKGFSIEANIFNFAHEIYGDIITIHFIQKIRNEIKFNHIADLQAQLFNDQRVAEEILQSYV